MAKLSPDANVPASSFIIMFFFLITAPVGGFLVEL